MNILLISILAVASLSLLPTKTLGSTEVQEQPQALPLASQTQPTTGGGGGGGGGEIWQEDDREVLIRNERGTKNNNGNGSGSGKRGGKNKKNKSNPIEADSRNVDEMIVSDLIMNDKKDIKNEEINKKLSNVTMKTQQQKQEEKHKNKQQPQDKQEEKHKNHGKHSNKNNLKTPLENKEISSSCRYSKSAWTECDQKTNTRSRTLTLKKGEDACVPTRTIQKKCKKACRYEKGTWSECTTGQMSRTDKLKSTSDPTCQATRVVNKNCNPGKSKDKSNKDRKNKDKGARKGRA